MAEVTYIICDDWCGLYGEGELVDEGHSIAPDDALRCFVNAHIEKVETREVTAAWLHERGCFPSNLNDIPQEAYVS